VSSRHHASDYVILIALGALLGGVVFLLVSYGWLQSEQRREDLRRTTRSAGRQGLMAFYLLCQRLGYDAQRVDRPLLDDTLAQVDALFLIDPTIPVNSTECAALARWMEAGGVLICAGGEPTLPQEVHRLGDPDAAPLEFYRWGIGLDDQARPVSGDRHLPLGADVTTTHLRTDAALRLGADGAAASAEVLFEDAAGVRVAGRPVGAGRVVRAADCSFLFNQTLGKADNAVLAINLVAWAQARSRGVRIGFDEYHGGYGQPESGWSVLGAMLVTTPAGWAVLSLTAAAVLYLVYRGRRFGTRRPPPPARRRSKLEYVQSVGATYQAVGARGLALGLLYPWFRRRAARRAGVEALASAEEIGRRLAPESPEKARRYADALAACEAALRAGRLTDRRFSALVAQLTRIETEALHGRQRGE